MKIGFHAPCLDHRGNTTVIYDYASAAKKYFGCDVHVVTSCPKSSHPMDKFEKIGYSLYNDPSELSGIIDKQKIDVLYMTTAGEDDGYTPKNCKTAIHVVFDMRRPFGDVYAGVSEWLAKHFGKELWVPHMIDLPKTTETLHDKAGIPRDAFVIGRVGGYNQFDVPAAQNAVSRALDMRKDLWAIFLNTKPFVEHPRALFQPFNPDNLFKSKFINTCDAMIHGRSDGETFGLAVGEFSSFNKPILTYDAPYWWYMRAHLDILGDKAIKYKDENELLQYLLQIDKNYVKDVEWDCYSVRFSPENVMKKFKEVFL